MDEKVPCGFARATTKNFPRVAILHKNCDVGKRIYGTGKYGSVVAIGVPIVSAACTEYSRLVLVLVRSIAWSVSANPGYSSPGCPDYTNPMSNIRQRLRSPQNFP